MADLGTMAASYSPDVNDTGLIGKVAKQVLEREEVPFLFDRLSKGAVKYGKDVEVSLMRAATGDTPTADSPDFEKKARDAFMFTTWTPRVYPIAVDYEDIDDASVGEAEAQRIASQYVDSLYTGASKEKNDNAVAAFVGAIATLGTDTPHIIEVGDAAEITNEATAQAYLAQVKTLAKKVRRGSPSVNPMGLSVPANAGGVIMIAPEKNITGVDVYARLNAEQAEMYGRFDVDYIIEYDADKYPTLNGATIIIDERYAQFYEKARQWGERRKIGADNGFTVEMALNTRDMFGLCRLFNAVMIGQADK